MPSLLKLNLKETKRLIEQIEADGGDAARLKEAFIDVTGKPPESIASNGQIPDEEHIENLRKQSAVEKGKNLQCCICGAKVKCLTSGVCEDCFKTWALTTKKEK